MDGTSYWDSSDTGAVTAYKKDAETDETDTSLTWNSTSADNPLAAEWTAGNDSNASNGLVRTYDRLSYSFTAYPEDSAATETESESETEGGSTGSTESTGSAVAASDSADDSSSASASKTIRVYVEVTLPLSSAEAEFYSNTLDSSEVIESDDGESQTLLGYKETTAGGGSASFTVTLNIKAMQNGDLVEPVFRSWVEGNEENEKEPTESTPTAVTVSAAGMYNLTLLRNTELSYTGYFDLGTGQETTKDAYEAAKESGDESIVYGTMLGYGVTVSMRNTITSKGKKGMESPVGEIEFDLSMTGALYLDGVAVTDTDGSEVYEAPYIWAYKANENTESGSSLNDTLRNVNMNWNDEDDASSTTQYAYDAAPYNVGGNSTSCYSGGAWSAAGSQPSSTDTETTVHFSVSGYTIDTSYSNYYPNAASSGDTTYFTGSYIKPFSAGYIQVIFPIDTSVIGDDTGYLSISMKGIVSDLDISDSRGTASGSDTSDSAADDLKFMVEWYETTEYAEHSTCEVTYLDNYTSTVTGLYVTNGSGEVIIKTNYFNNESNSTLSGENGNGSTPIDSTVYIGSDINFDSNEYTTTDETSIHYNKDFDSATDNIIEYDYLTAVNLLQKFDAEAYTPSSTSLEIVNQTYTLTSATNNITDASGNTIFRITTTESATFWSTSKTRSYTLTILYAAKSDGSNWTYSADEQGYSSPVADMDAATEEDLIYFTTLQALYDYFGGKGVCVGILYEFRDCCIRNDRSISVTARMDVTDDFEKAGLTFCITNDVLGWTTYRPEYKSAYAAGTLSGQLYSFSWANVDSGNGYYGTGDGTFPKSYYDAYTAYEDASGGYGYRGKAKIERYDNDYVKTEYESGWMVGSTHTGWWSGNTLLLYTMDSNIDIEVADIIEGSNDTPKTEYDLGKGERTASFVVTPTIATSSSVSNELVTNGTQSAEVEITITLPKHLNFDEGSLTFDYSDSDYEDGGLSWEITYTENEDGTTTIVLSTSVTDISKTLPTIEYTCTIGKPGAAESDEDEVTNGETLTSTATINTTYEENGQSSTYAKEDSVTISVVRTTADNIWIEADGRVELGEDLVYTLHYSNTAVTTSSILIGDVLPYNEDGRGTSFSGGYQVTQITLTFGDETTYQEFLYSGVISFAAGVTYSTESADQIAILNALADTDSGNRTVIYTSDSSTGVTTKNDSESSTWTLTLDLTILDDDTQTALTQLANTETGIAFYFGVLNVSGQSSVQIDFTLSPDVTVEVNSAAYSTLIGDGDGSVQEGGDVYQDNMFYKLSTGNIAVMSNSVKITAVERTLSGIAWLDQDHDGLYNTVSGSTDKTMEGIDVYLYTTTAPSQSDFYTGALVTETTDSESGTIWTQTVTTTTSSTDGEGNTVTTETTETIELGTLTITAADGTPVTLYPAIDVLGNLVASRTTGSNGAYSFGQLAEGTYYVIFQDDRDNYTLAGSSGSAPLSFGQLSVTVNKSSTSVTGAYNRASAYYGSNSDADGSPAKLVLADIPGISLPALASIYGSSYEKNNQNAGFYYIELNLEKVWENIIDEVSAGATVEFTVTGTSQGTYSSTDTGTGETVETAYEYENSYVLSQESNTTSTAEGEVSGKVSAKAEETESSIAFEVVTVSGTGTKTAAQSAGYAAPSLTVSETTDSNTNLKTVTWTLGTIALQAEDTFGVIDYSAVEAAYADSNKKEELVGFVTAVAAETKDSTITFTATNTQVLYELELYKISISNSTTSYLSNATFTLYSGPNCTAGTEVTSISGSASAVSGADASSDATSADTENGKLYIGKLAAGTYYLKETVAPSGYTLNQSVWKIVISYNKSTPTTPVITVTLVKDADGNEIANPTKFQSSTVTTGGTEKVYVTPDTSTSEGTDTLYTISFQMANEIIYALPQTGSIGIAWPTLAGIALMLAALVMNERKKWRINA
ncbi:MAG: LPXTG cell wall anchor domain-containing protein [Lachnospiraceae bacterium]|nr:LPXTG cell wall anchor domain-containing protein [Lachnospiraceae bacterium]